MLAFYAISAFLWLGVGANAGLKCVDCERGG